MSEAFVPLETKPLTFAGISVKTPLVAAAGTAGLISDFVPLTDVNVFGAMTFKSITPLPQEGSAHPRVCECATGWINSIGLQNDGCDVFIREHYPQTLDIPVVKIVSIAATSIEDYATLTKRVAALPGDDLMIELNLSCPNVKAHSAASPFFSSDPILLAEVVSACAAVKGPRPLIAKLSPHTASLAATAQAAEHAGADGLSIMNTIRGLAIDTKRWEPLIASGIGGYSGQGIFPIALAMVHEAFQATKLPIIGIGGVSSHHDVIAMMLAGASLVGIGTASLMAPHKIPGLYRKFKAALKNRKLAPEDLIGSLKTTTAQ